MLGRWPPPGGRGTPKLCFKTTQWAQKNKPKTASEQLLTLHSSYLLAPHTHSCLALMLHYYYNNTGDNDRAAQTPPPR
eukprot:3469709-Pyramimonas_sp.AAC.1